MNKKVILDFPHNYTVEILDETPSNYRGLHYYYPGARLNGGQDGLLLKISSDTPILWIGTFAKGIYTAKVVTGVFSMPNPETVCVVSQGLGCIVSVHNPASHEIVKESVITGVMQIIDIGLIIFVGLTTITAYDTSGIKWHTKQISWDNLEVIEVAPNMMKGKYWDMRSDSDKEFTVDMETGESVGGVE